MTCPLRDFPPQKTAAKNTGVNRRKVVNCRTSAPQRFERSLWSVFKMGDFSEWEILEMVELEKEIEESGVSNIEEFFRKRLEKWRDVEVNIAITGDSGSGKSSFINAIRE